MKILSREELNELKPEFMKFLKEVENDWDSCHEPYGEDEWESLNGVIYSSDLVILITREGSTVDELRYEIFPGDAEGYSKYGKMEWQGDSVDYYGNIASFFLGREV